MKKGLIDPLGDSTAPAMFRIYS